MRKFNNAALRAKIKQAGHRTQQGLGRFVRGVEHRMKRDTKR